MLEIASGPTWGCWGLLGALINDALFTTNGHPPSSISIGIALCLAGGRSTNYWNFYVYSTRSCGTGSPSLSVPPVFFSSKKSRLTLTFDGFRLTTFLTTGLPDPLPAPPPRSPPLYTPRAPLSYFRFELSDDRICYSEVLFRLTPPGWNAAAAGSLCA